MVGIGKRGKSKLEWIKNVIWENKLENANNFLGRISTTLSELRRYIPYQAKGEIQEKV